jgi:hypothetical protein
MLAFRAMAIPAGMIGIMSVTTVIAMPGLSAEFGRAASCDIPHGLDVAGQDVSLMLVLIIGSVLADNVRQ